VSLPGKRTTAAVSGKGHENTPHGKSPVLFFSAYRAKGKEKGGEGFESFPDQRGEGVRGCSLLSRLTSSSAQPFFLKKRREQRPGGDKGGEKPVRVACFIAVFATMRKEGRKGVISTKKKGGVQLDRIRGALATVVPYGGVARKKKKKDVFTRESGGEKGEPGVNVPWGKDPA